MNIDEMKAYLLDELHEEWKNAMVGKDNNYPYLFMICNDMGLTMEGPDAPVWAPKI